MRARMLAAAGCACVLGFFSFFAPLAAKDALLSLQLDGRPLDAGTPSGMLHRGKAFVNVVRVVRGFNGLLTFGKGERTVRVTIGTHTADFTIGTRAGSVNGDPTTFSAPPYVLNGDTYVPLDVIAQLAGATLSVDTHNGVARLKSAPPSPAP